MIICEDSAVVEIQILTWCLILSILWIDVSIILGLCNAVQFPSVVSHYMNNQDFQECLFYYHLLLMNLIICGTVFLLLLLLFEQLRTLLPKSHLV